MDLGYIGPAYTWSNCATQDIYDRLDGAIASSSWRLLFQDVVVHHLPRILSDHAPILMNTIRKTKKKQGQFQLEYFLDLPPSIFGRSSKFLEQG